MEVKWSVSRPDCFNFAQKNPVTDYSEGFAGFKNRLEHGVKKKKSLPIMGIEPRLCSR
jgi:hypothetical protein